MNLVVIDLDRLKWLTKADKLKINEEKVCGLTIKDFGKKTLLRLPKGNSSVLEHDDALYDVKI